MTNLRPVTVYLYQHSVNAHRVRSPPCIAAGINESGYEETSGEFPKKKTVGILRFRLAVASAPLDTLANTFPKKCCHIFGKVRRLRQNVIKVAVTRLCRCASILNCGKVH